MFNRLKGAIDYVDQRFQEEQARAKAAQAQSTRSNSTVRNSEAKGSARTSRTTSVDRRQKETLTRGPDPSEFDPEFAIGDESESSRMDTPGPAKAQAEEGDSLAASTREVAPSTESKPAELSQDVQLKLRKLERLEFKYQELLRSYRIAHARVSAVEPFEAALRENTPLTSISDPLAFTEYLNQVNLKGDLVLDELKRVTAENAKMKKRLEEAEDETRKAWDEVTEIKSPKTDLTRKQDEGASSKIPNVRDTSIDNETATASDATSGDLKADTAASLKAKLGHSMSSPPAARVTLSNLFATKPQAHELSKEGKGSEDLFSYDSELPRLEAELRQSQEEVTRLQGKVLTLSSDLKTAREDTEGMARDLEATTNELNVLRNVQRDSKSQSDRLMKELEAADTKYRKLEHDAYADGRPSASDESKMADLEAELEKLRLLRDESEEKSEKIDKLRAQLERLEEDLSNERSQNESKTNTSNRLFSELKEELGRANEEITTMKAEKGKLELVLKDSESLQAQSVKKMPTEADEDEREKAEIDIDKPASSKKNKKKKRKTGKTIAATDSGAKSEGDQAVSNGRSQVESTVQTVREQLDKALASLEEKQRAIQKLEDQLKEQGSQQEEIDFLRNEVRENGQELVDAREKIKELETEKEGLGKTIQELRNELVEARGSQASTSAEIEKAHIDLVAHFEDLKIQSKSLETDLLVAQQLASSRFKDLNELREKMQKAQPEIRSLRSENEALKDVKMELNEKTMSLDRLQIKHDGLQAQTNDLKKNVTEKNREISTLNNRLGMEADSRQKLEAEARKTKGDLSSAQSEAKNASQSLERVSGELSQARQNVRRHENRIRELEARLETLEQEESKLKEEIELKSAQHASAESLMNSMRDQTSEMAMQLKEARERCDGLDEEVADTHRLLSERTKEGETMRRLLGEVETRTETRIRDMRDRMDTAIEERERIEDEASAASRKRAREVEEARNKLRAAERELRAAQDGREELESVQKDWKRRREELEQFVERNKADTEEAKTAMARIRDALDDSEKQARDLEKQKGDLRRSLEDSRTQIDKLEKRNKALADEVRLLQSKPKVASAPSGTSSSPARTSGPRASTPSTSTEEQISQAAYLKNILLQFLEMKEKKHQVQFVPTLATLLQLDSSDQQKWTAAIMSK